MSKLNGFFYAQNHYTNNFDPKRTKLFFMKTIIEHSVLMTRKEVSNYLKSSIKTVDRLLRDGRISGFKIGSKVLIYAESITEENINAVKPKYKK